MRHHTGRSESTGSPSPIMATSKKSSLTSRWWGPHCTQTWASMEKKWNGTQTSTKVSRTAHLKGPGLDCLFVLRRKNKLAPALLKNYHCTIASASAYGWTVHYVSCTTSEKKQLRRSSRSLSGTSGPTGDLFKLSAMKGHKEPGWPLPPRTHSLHQPSLWHTQSHGVVAKSFSIGETSNPGNGNDPNVVYHYFYAAHKRCDPKWPSGQSLKSINLLLSMPKQCGSSTSCQM